MTSSNDQSSADLKVVGLNAHGAKSNLTFIQTLFETYHITFISEHWLSNAEKMLIKDCLSNDYKLHFSTAEKKSTGRPFGGNLFVVNKSFVGNTTVVHEDPHIYAIKTSGKLKPYLFIGVYLTCFHDGTSIVKYKEELDTLTGLIKSHMDECNVLVLGDFQSFPNNVYDASLRTNGTRNPLSNCLSTFLQTNGLEFFDIIHGTGPTYTYQHKTLPHSSYIDHIAMFGEDHMPFTDCIVHPLSASNLSDHQPIEITISCEKAPTLQNVVRTELQQFVVPKYAWKDENFKQEYSITVQQNSHKLTMDAPPKTVCKILIDAATSAYRKCFPEEEKKFGKGWWTPHLSQLKGILSTHFNIWKSHGFPRGEGNVHFNRYILARKNFRKGVKFAQNKKVYESLLKMNNLRNIHPKKFWTKIRQMRSDDSKRLFEVNGKKTSEDIAKEFGDNFNSLLNNPVIGRNADDGRSIPNPDGQTTVVLNVENVVDAINKLKEYKAADPFSMVSEHVIYADCDQLLAWMCNFYNTILRNQEAHEALSESIIHPLVKSYKKSLKSFNNYRGISIIPVLTKILEYIILGICPELKVSHVLQHGYKDESSTMHAEFLIRETIHYYHSNNSPVYVCGLDAEKAFDSCNWDILFEKLYYEKKIPLPIVNVIKSLYSNGTAKVKYNGKISKEFSLSQGVRQGSVLSPHLYNIYSDELLRTIESDLVDCGTSLHGSFTGILMYADDVILMSTTLAGLKKMINTCVSVCNKNCINFNADKTEFCVSKGHGGFMNYFNMNGFTIEPADSLKHLGVLWNVKKNTLTMDDENVSGRLTKFWSVIKTLVKDGIRFCHPSTIRQLFISLAIPTLTYGLELCDLSVGFLQKLDTEGRKALKSLFNISSYSRNYLEQLLNIEKISTRLIKNKLGLLVRLLNTDKTSEILMKMFQQHSHKGSFSFDLQDIASRLELDLAGIIVSKNYPSIQSEHIRDIDQVVQDRLTHCLNNWHEAGSRAYFINFMEERVVRLD